MVKETKNSKHGFGIICLANSHPNYYLSATTSTEYKVYYFTKNNICAAYVYTLKNVSFSDYEQSLYKIGYTKYSDGKYYSDKYIAKIEYDSQFGCWYVSMGLK
jgi:hypothetical protein